MLDRRRMSVALTLQRSNPDMILPARIPRRLSIPTSIILIQLNRTKYKLIFVLLIILPINRRSLNRALDRRGLDPAHRRRLRIHHIYR